MIMTVEKLKRRRFGDYFFVGRWEMYGGEWIGVFGQHGNSGGNFKMGDESQVHPKDNGKRIVVGLDQDDWADCLSVLLHESVEWAAARLHCRLAITDRLDHTSAGYVFHMNHEDFAEILYRAGRFMTPALPELCNIYQAYRKLYPSNE